MTKQELLAIWIDQVDRMRGELLATDQHETKRYVASVTEVMVMQSCIFNLQNLEVECLMANKFKVGDKVVHVKYPNMSVYTVTGVEETRIELDGKMWALSPELYLLVLEPEYRVSTTNSL